MATTTNYGWTTPDNTGYVKDGALAIRTLGNAIDATLYSIPKAGQVVQATTTTTTGTTGTTYVDATNVTATITPTASTSKILVTMNFSGWVDGATDSKLEFIKAQMVRGSTSIYETGAGLTSTGYQNSYSGGSAFTIWYPFSISFVDSPATTSATTYKLQFKKAYSDPVQVGIGSSLTTNTSVVILQEILA